jgi:hypothetical protein
MSHPGVEPGDKELEEVKRLEKELEELRSRWTTVKVPREALKKLDALRERLVKDLCSTEECRTNLRHALSPGRFLDAVLDVINKGDYAFALKVVVRLYENTTGISAYNTAKEILAKQYGYRY